MVVKDRGIGSHTHAGKYSHHLRRKCVRQAPMAQSDRSVAVWDTSTRSRRAQTRSQLTIDDASLDSLLVDEDRAATSS